VLFGLFSYLIIYPFSEAVSPAPFKKILKQKIMKKIVTLLAAVLLTATTYAQIGLNNENPDASAALDITSTTGGVLVPRMTAAQRDAITATQGLIIFCTDCALGEGELQIKHTSSWKNTIGGDVNDPAPAIGDFYQGGVVFHLFVEGETGYVAGETHGLIAAVADQSSGIKWYNDSFVTTGAIWTAVGTGSANTNAIISVQGPTQTSYAAGLARAYTEGEYFDWFLPSRDELNKMWLERQTINTTASANGGSNFSEPNYYWSSTELDVNNAWYQNFGSGYQSSLYKNYTPNVRAVRAF